MTIEFITENFVIPSIIYGIGIGCVIFFIGFGINLCFKLFNS